MFLLYRKKDRAFPESVKINGKLYCINADFRNILRIFDMLDDGNIPEYKKIEKLAGWFFEDVLNFPENIPPEIITETFIDFLRVNDKGTAAAVSECENNCENGRQFCYNFDAGEIYAGFLSEYGIDLICADFLHWHKFKILLGNLSPDSAFKKKIELRFMDLSGLSTDGGRKFAELARAKEAVQLPDEFGIKESKELTEINEFNEIWGKAGNN